MDTIIDELKRLVDLVDRDLKNVSDFDAQSEVIETLNYIIKQLKEDKQ